MEYQKSTEGTSSLIGDKIADKITKNLQRNNSERITNENDKEIPKERYIYIYIYIYPEERQKIVDNLALI